MDDVVIAGGGPAGAMAAIVLARAGLRVRVFDRDRFPRPKLCGDTLNPGGCRTLQQYLPLAALFTHARPIDGMLLTGPRGVRVQGRYGRGLYGHAIDRRTLDAWLLEQTIASGAQVDEECTVDEAVASNGRVTGVRVRARGTPRTHDARLVIAADGRHSRLAFALGLARHPSSPRRWAIGAYFDGVEQLSESGEMHVRQGHYIGVAPLAKGLANVCLVVPHEPRNPGTSQPRNPDWRDAREKLLAALAADPELAPRFAVARMIDKPTVLGPMAVDAPTPGVPGLLLAGDAAGFIDPMTGDGLTFALRGSVLAAHVALDVLQGTLPAERAVDRLATDRRRAFATKWRFNRSLRRLVASPRSVAGAAVAARVMPHVFQAMIRYAGDV
jgi:flavin-dependent dehydrogenase